MKRLPSLLFIAALTFLPALPAVAVDPLILMYSRDPLRLEVAGARVSTFDSKPNESKVEVRLSAQSAMEFYDWSLHHLFKKVAISIDDVVITTPVLQTPINGGELPILAPSLEAAAIADALAHGRSSLSVSAAN